MFVEECCIWRDWSCCWVRRPCTDSRMVRREQPVLTWRRLQTVETTATALILKPPHSLMKWLSAKHASKRAIQLMVNEDFISHYGIPISFLFSEQDMHTSFQLFTIINIIYLWSNENYPCGEIGILEFEKRINYNVRCTEQIARLFNWQECIFHFVPSNCEGEERTEHQL